MSGRSRAQVTVTVPVHQEGEPVIFPGQDPLLSIHLASNCGDCLNTLKSILKREGCRILAEVPFHREIEREIGLDLRNYTVLVVWEPSQTYQGLLSERGAGLFLPFHFLVSDEGNSTLVAALDLSFLARSACSLGVQLLLGNLQRKIRSVFSELYRRDTSDSAALQRNEQPQLSAVHS